MIIPTAVPVEVRNAAADPKSEKHSALGETEAKAVDGHRQHFLGLVVEATAPLLGAETAAKF